MIYTCTIPVNTISTDQAIRVRSHIFSASGSINCDLYINGTQIAGGSINVANAEYSWGLLIFNTGSTTGEAAGLIPFYNSSETFLRVAPWSESLSGLDWDGNQTIAFEFEGPTTTTAQGKVFLVEAVD